jgi:hypothetical protein
MKQKAEIMYCAGIPVAPPGHCIFLSFSALCDTKVQHVWFAHTANLVSFSHLASLSFRNLEIRLEAGRVLCIPNCSSCLAIKIRKRLVRS